MKVLLKTTIKRESGKLYYLKNDDNGCLIVCEEDRKEAKKKK